MKNNTLILLLCLVSLRGWATTPPDEGMWLPMFIERLNYTDMKAKGLKLTAEEIYSINQSSLKDAIVMLGGGFCTAEMISEKGLVLTNHHCAYDMIQSHSTVDNDILTNGFWAKTLAEEKPNPGITASFLVRMDDVTAKVLEGITDATPYAERQQKTTQAMRKIQEEAAENGKYTAAVKSFFDGNEYYLFVYQTYQDVRLVGNPPESVGKYGGDTDNWMWPRHTGDFALLRIYTGKDGQPAEYAADNVPLKPRKHLNISLDGYKENEYAMVMGFPGNTDRYLSSYGVKLAVDQSNPKRVELRQKRLELWKSDMDANDKVRLQYASKYASISNYWKYFIGQTKGLKRMRVVGQKEQQEKKFMDWANADATRKAKYGNITKDWEQGYTLMAQYNLSYIHLLEGVFGSEILPFSYEFGELAGALQEDGPESDKVKQMIAGLKKQAEAHFKDYHQPTDHKVTQAVLELFHRDVPKDQQPGLFGNIDSEFGGDIAKFTTNLFETSIFASQEKCMAFLDAPSAEVLGKDPAFLAMNDFMSNYFGKIAPSRRKAADLISNANRLYVDGLRQMESSRKFYPNANSTLRLSYGQVKDYVPADGAFYSYYTTTDGILQKEDPQNPEFVVPAKLRQLIEAKDFGRYAQNGRLRVAFITNLDITGGNSGSPVMNAYGDLIGVAFDGNWEAMSGDIAFDAEYKRCISVDIRYVLFIIEKLGGAKHIVDEMTIVSRKPLKTKEFEETLVPIKY